MTSKKIYYPRQEATKILGINNQAIRKLRLEGKIETIPIGTRHLYNVYKFINKEEFEEEFKEQLKDEEIIRKKICYCRVSSHSQKIELDNQIEYMKQKYQEHEIYTDGGSGINFQRRNFLKIIDYAINNQLDELVISYKDRLCRIAYDLIELIIKKYSNGNIIVVNDEENKSPEKEVTEDLLQIITCFSSRLYGMRSYKNEGINVS